MFKEGQLLKIKKDKYHWFNHNEEFCSNMYTFLRYENGNQISVVKVNKTIGDLRKDSRIYIDSRAMTRLKGISHLPNWF